MQLLLSELAKSLNMNPDIVERWIRQGRIPVKQRHNTCIFVPETLEKWAAAHNVNLNMPGSRETLRIEEKPQSLLTAIEQGGIYYDLPGKMAAEVLREAAQRMDAIKSRQLKDLLYERLMDREQMMSTGIGNGVAVPHPRAPIIDDGVNAQIATCFLEAPVDFHAVDKKPVFIMFVLVAPTAKQHLYLLSRISFCLRDDSFMQLLKTVPDRDVLLREIAGLESRLDQDNR